LELKAIKLLMDWPALIPPYMYLAQCFHCEEMSCMEDFGLTAEVITDNVLSLAGLDCSITQRQALSWIDIVHCMLESDVFNEREDRRSLVLQFLRCTFMQAPLAAQPGTWTERVDGGEDHSVWSRLRLQVEYALQGKIIGAYEDLAWLANVYVEAPPSIVSGTGRKRHIGANATPMESERKKIRR
jgi:hypothetical protein